MYVEVKHIADIVGEWGKWQSLFFTHCILLWATGAFVNMGFVFHTKRVDFWCADTPTNLTSQHLSDETKCYKYINPNESCTHWEYNRTQFRKTIITEFDLVCNRANYASLTQSCFIMGYVFSGLIVSHFSDKYGRRPVVFICYAIEILGVISCALSYNIYQYLISRFLTGLGYSGLNGALFCSGPKYRSYITIYVIGGWVLGYVLLPPFAYWLPDFRYMQFASALPLILLLIWFYYFHESPRWQLVNGQVDMAEVTIRKALQMNGKSVDNLREQMIQLANSIQTSESIKNKKGHNLLDLFKTPNMRKYTLILWYAWVVNAVIYYGISLNMGDFGGNFYISFLLSGLMELPANLLTPLFLRYIGRRKLYAIFMIITGASCVAVIAADRTSWLRVLLALVGKYGISSSWNVVVIHGSEIYPTVIRTTGLGVVSVVGRLASISAPFMGNLASVTSLTFVMLLYGVLTAVGAVLVLYLPETKDKEIPDTLEEAENLDKNNAQKISSFYIAFIKDTIQVKHIADIVGEWGKWQFILCAHCFLLWSSAAFINMGYAFHAKRVDFWCADTPTNITSLTLSDETKCHKYINPNESCTQWEYNKTQFLKTIITEFDLVCDRANYASLTQAFFMFGYVVSGLIVAHYSDKYGRRPMVLMCYAIEILGIISCAFSYNIYQYLISRLLVGVVLECCGPKYRSDIQIVAGIGWVLGYVLLPPFAYWLPDFRYMQLISALPLIAMLIWFYYLYESPRWQLANGQVDRAEVTIKKALQMNGKSVDNLHVQMLQLANCMQATQKVDKKEKAHNVLDLLKKHNIRKCTLIIWYSWVVNALIYYGLSFNMGDFGGNFYVTFVLSGLMELPAQLLTLLLLRYIGRRKLYAIFMIITGASCVAVIAADQSSWLRVLLALVGKYGISSSWNVIQIHGSEIYPTVVRNIAVGVASVVGRVGSISAPFMGNLASVTSLTFVMVLYGVLTAVGAVLVLYLPETKDKEIPDTLEEAEHLYHNNVI
ncbi:unnamed protein product [Medioppia subpectinata]|uniref:Major facilitator superfamily (MFS) profile domain-containing protein n=1 Tax=Medioppia subpectinata TaxID=1979941 RepID=A0A7R9KB33_9ACAR|nr:unnamed protein product [Medioppia subpectinata]CAG2100135.1 unnamed protein product [Medioppia subpectinata]